MNNEQTKEKTLFDTLKTICIIFLWSFFMLDKYKCIELDTQFKGMKPYFYCFSQGIVFNESVPLGITIALIECSEIFFCKLL